MALPTVDIGQSVERIFNPTWIKQEALKQGTLISICTYQSLNGLVDGYHFNHKQNKDTHLIDTSNYHQFVTAQRITGIATGWLLYANWQNKRQPLLAKTLRVIGSSLIARNAFEWSYKYARYGDPFDYSKKHNEHSLVYFGFRDGRLVDCYIGTGPMSGPAVDIACLAVGMWLFR